MSIQLSKEEKKLADIELKEIKEKAFKLIVKIISWENGSNGSIVVQSANKITPEEWQQYKKERMNAFSAADKDKGRKEIEESFNSIKAHGGFK